jgi:hypothetical protein
MINEKLNFFHSSFFLRDFSTALYAAAVDVSSWRTTIKGSFFFYFSPSLVVADSQLLLTAAAVTKCKKHINVAVLLLYFCLMIDDFC